MSQPPQQGPPYGQQSPGPYGQNPYGPPPTNPYGQPGYPRQQGTNTLAIVALVLAFVFWPAGLICGIIARAQIKRSGEDGQGLALAGLILSAVFGVLTIVYIVVVVIAVVAAVHNGPGSFPTPTPTF